MTSVEEKYNNFKNSNPINIINSSNQSLEGKISELLDVKYRTKKIKVESMYKTNEILKKLKILKRKYTNKSVNLSINLKRKLILKNMLELIEKHEEYIKQLDKEINFNNYDEILILISFLDQEFDNNFNYLNFLMEYINQNNKKEKSMDYVTEYEDTRDELDIFFQERIQDYKPKIKQK